MAGLYQAAANVWRNRKANALQLYSNTSETRKSMKLVLGQ